MFVDFRIKEGPHGGLSFDFIPFSAPPSYPDNDDVVSGVFNIREEAFLFLEPMIARSFDDWWSGYRHWGKTHVSCETWLEILARFDTLRLDIRRNVRQHEIVKRHVSSPRLLPARFELHRKALIDFLDRFEARIRLAIRVGGGVMIQGI